MIRIFSPCVSECQLDKTKTYCLGCKRTKQEIGEWLSLTQAEQLEKIEELKHRCVDR